MVDYKLCDVREGKKYIFFLLTFSVLQLGKRQINKEKTNRIVLTCTLHLLALKGVVRIWGVYNWLSKGKREGKEHSWKKANDFLER